MWIFRVFVHFFVLVFFGLYLLYWPAADGLCRHPDHEANERISFSNPFKNKTYPENTIATFFCEISTEKDNFKVASCEANGTWTVLEISSNINCSLAPRNRCQRPFKQGVNPSLKSLMFDTTCFSLHQGINDTSLDNFMDECDTRPFRADKISHASTGLLQEEIREMCKTFLMTSEYNGAKRKILLAVETNKTDLSLWEKFKQLFKSFFRNTQDGSDPPKCYYLECSFNPKECSVEFEKCEADQNYWICKYNISSCGIPSQPSHSTMNYSGIYVGDSAAYQCQDGYVSNSSPKRKCQENGYWSESSNCQPVDCGKPDVNENVTYELVTRNETTYRNWVMHKCILPGETINGSEYRMCMASGKWQGESPVCQPSPVQPSESGAETSTFVNSSSGLKPGEADLLKLIIGITVGVTLFLIVLMWLILSVMLWREKDKRKLDG